MLQVSLCSLLSLETSDQLSCWTRKSGQKRNYCKKDRIILLMKVPDNNLETTIEAKLFQKMTSRQKLRQKVVQKIFWQIILLQSMSSIRQILHMELCYAIQNMIKTLISAVFKLNNHSIKKHLAASLILYSFIFLHIRGSVAFLIL